MFVSVTHIGTPTPHQEGRTTLVDISVVGRVPYCLLSNAPDFHRIPVHSLRLGIHPIYAYSIAIDIDKV